MEDMKNSSSFAAVFHHFISQPALSRSSALLFLTVISVLSFFGALCGYTVYFSDPGYPMHPDSITDWLDKFSERNDLPHINPHAFRHTLASVLCLNGIDMTTISKWLGHKNVTTTMNIYEHILDKGKKQVVDCVADVILRKKNDAASG